jgi:hypothetical protein
MRCRLWKLERRRHEWYDDASCGLPRREGRPKAGGDRAVVNERDIAPAHAEGRNVLTGAPSGAPDADSGAARASLPSTPGRADPGASSAADHAGRQRRDPACHADEGAHRCLERVRRATDPDGRRRPADPPAAPGAWPAGQHRGTDVIVNADTGRPPALCAPAFLRVLLTDTRGHGGVVTRRVPIRALGPQHLIFAFPASFSAPPDVVRAYVATVDGRESQTSSVPVRP